MQLFIDLKPLSVNKAWQGRRFKTEDYKNYERDCLYLLPKGKKIYGYIDVKYDFYIKYFKTSDVGNFEKPLSDILVKSGIIEDDKFIKRLIIEKHESKKQYIKITIREWT